MWLNEGSSTPRRLQLALITQIANLPDCRLLSSPTCDTSAVPDGLVSLDQLAVLVDVREEMAGVVTDAMENGSLLMNGHVIVLVLLRLFPSGRLTSGMALGNIGQVLRGGGLAWRWREDDGFSCRSLLLDGIQQALVDGPSFLPSMKACGGAPWRSNLETLDFFLH